MAFYGPTGEQATARNRAIWWQIRLVGVLLVKGLRESVTATDSTMVVDWLAWFGMQRETGAAQSGPAHFMLNAGNNGVPGEGWGIRNDGPKDRCRLCVRGSAQHGAGTAARSIAASGCSAVPHELGLD